jgi:hypothetical protein
LRMFSPFRATWLNVDRPWRVALIGVDIAA